MINNYLNSDITSHIFDLFFPTTCLNCGRLLTLKRRYLCLFCLSELELSLFSGVPGNPVELTLKGRVPLMAGTSLFIFQKKGPVQILMHALKYGNKPQIGHFLGLWLAEEIKRSHRFEDIDLVITVPLHPRKKKKRGYNQVEAFGRTLARQIGVPCQPDLLKKVSEGQSQTHKGRSDRISVGYYEIELKNARHFYGMHVLLVDDIITTGATLEACYLPMREIPGLRISIACMAYTV